MINSNNSSSLSRDFQSALSTEEMCVELMPATNPLWLKCIRWERRSREAALNVC